MTVRPRVLLAVPLVVAAAAWAQPPVTVRLHHRSAESLVTVLRPLVAPAALAGSGAQLQITAPAADVPRVLHLIEQSDRPLQPLVVALRDDPPPAAEAQPPADSGSVELSTGRPLQPDPQGNAQVLSTGRPMPADPQGNAQVLSTGRSLPAGPGGNARVLSTQSLAAASQILEGDPLRVSLPASQSLWVGARAARGARKPQPGAGSANGGPPGAATDVAGAVHFDATADFVARIWLAGQTVAIDLRPLDAGRVDAAPESPESGTIYGKIGQWIALADSGAAPPASGAAAAAAARTGVWIRVEPVRPQAGSE